MIDQGQIANGMNQSVAPGNRSVFIIILGQRPAVGLPTLGHDMFDVQTARHVLGFCPGCTQVALNTLEDQVEASRGQ